MKPLIRSRFSSFQRGFGMMEVMILTVVVSLVYNLAYPTYENYQARQHRIEAQAALLKAMQAEQRYQTANQRYLAYDSTSTQAAAAGLLTFSGSNKDSSSHRISARACKDSPSPFDTGICVEVVATPFGMPGTGQRIGGPQDVTCGALILDSDGNRYLENNGARIAAVEQPECWRY